MEPGNGEAAREFEVALLKEKSPCAPSVLLPVTSTALLVEADAVVASNQAG